MLTISQVTYSLPLSTQTHASDLADQLSSTLKCILDIHAPIRSKIVELSPRIWTLCLLGLFRSLLRFLHLSLRMFSMLVLKRVIFLLRRKGRLFIRDLRNHRLTLMIYLTLVSSQTLALFLSCLSGLFMLSCSFILMTMNWCLQFSLKLLFSR